MQSATILLSLCALERRVLRVWKRVVKPIERARHSTLRRVPTAVLLQRRSSCARMRHAMLSLARRAAHAYIVSRHYGRTVGGAAGRPPVLKLTVRLSRRRYGPLIVRRYDRWS